MNDIPAAQYSLMLELYLKHSVLVIYFSIAISPIIISLQESKHLYLYFTDSEANQFREMPARLVAINQTDTSAIFLTVVIS